MNDGGCDPDGRFYCGSISKARRGGAKLYRLDAYREVRTVLDGATISNGLEWTRDGARAYYVDSATQRIDVFDYDSRAGLVGRRAFAAIPDSAGTPDGLTVDSEGGVWVALFGGSAVRRYTSGGKLDVVLEVPARQVTACTFGGDRLDELFITTSRENLPADADRLAGSLFRARVGVRGLPAREFTG
jgi:sugar lactone lactonase YvrE